MSLMDGVSETIKSWEGLNIAINKVDSWDYLAESLCIVCYNHFLGDLF